MKPFLSQSFLLAAALAACAVLPALAGAYEDGVHYYNSGNYQYALVSLSQACGQNPKHVMAHYYLANVMVKAKMHDQAMVEYATCYKLDPRSPVASYCLQAIERFRQVRNEPIQRTLADATIPGITDVHNASSVIRRQAQYEKQKHQVVGDAMARSLSAEAESKNRKLHSLAEEEIERVLEPPRFFPGFGRPPVNSLGYTAEEAKAKAEEIRKNTEEMAAMTKLAAAGRAQQYKSWSSERQHALDDVVENLEKQLREPTKNGVKLQPVGTDLYVRFYGYHRASAHLPDVHPAEVRFTDRDGLNFETEAAAHQEKLGPAPGPDPRSVRGKVLEKQLR